MKFAVVCLRNFAGLLVLLGVHYISDRYYMHLRPGYLQFSPYVFLVAMYLWIVFHNRILYDGLYRKGKKGQYFVWTSLILIVSSINMGLVLYYVFELSDMLPHVLGIWVYTLAGLGVYMIYQNLTQSPEVPVVISSPDASIPLVFECTVDGRKESILLGDILYAESLENYIKMFTVSGIHIIRLSLKETEARLPLGDFVRISRSHIVNMNQEMILEPDAVIVNGKTLKIGKVYKRYAESQFRRTGKIITN